MLALLAVAALAGGAGVVAYATHLLRRSELQTIDARFSIRGKRSAPKDIVFVAISLQAEKELEEAHRQARSPLPRRYDAAVIDNLRRAGARVIAMDLQFTNESPNPEEDNELIEAVGRAHGKVVLATEDVGPHGATHIFGGEPLLREIGARPAEIRLTLDTDGSMRRFERQYSGLGSFPVVAAEVMTGKRIPASTFAGRLAPDRLRGAARKRSTRSPTPRCCGRLPAGHVPGQARDRRRLRADPAGRARDLDHERRGHARAGNLGERDRPRCCAACRCRTRPGWLNIVLILLLGAAVPLGSLRVRRWRSLLDALALAAVFTVAVQIAFNSGLIVSFVYPLLALVLGDARHARASST